MKTRIRKYRRGRPQILPNQPDAEQVMILNRMVRGEKLFLLEERAISPDVGIGASREHSKILPSRLFGYLVSGGWISFVTETREFELTSQGYRAVELFRPSTRVGSKRTFRTNKRAY